MTKKRIVFIIIISILLLLNVAFIWSNSFRGPASSLNQSSKVYDSTFNAMETVIGKDQTGEIKKVVTLSVFRKFAHVGEFLCLGLLTNILLYTAFFFKPFNFLIAEGFGLFVAGIDETIQAFTMRAPALFDVLVDMSGFTLLTVIFFTVFFIKSNKHTTKKE